MALQVRELGFTRTPFAVKCSGHNTNPGFSSTPGVQISMSHFKDIALNEEEGTVTLGAGLIWTEVFAYLVPKGLNVVGGRLTGVGVGGLILGGGRHTLPACRPYITFAQRYTSHVLGYSWKTNQYGLTIDTVTAFELVLPNGLVKHVTEKDKALWFALRVRPSSVTEYWEQWSHSSLKGRVEQLRELVERALWGTMDNNFD